MKNRTAPSKTVAASAGAVLGVAALFYAFSAPASAPALELGEPAPLFTVTDMAGRRTALEDYRGKVLLVDFWATWCVTCEREVPELKALHERFTDGGFDILAASVDQGDPGEVARFTTKHALPYKVVFANAEAVRSYNVSGLPAKFLIDQEGLLVKNYAPETSIEEIAEDISSALKR